MCLDPRFGLVAAAIIGTAVSCLANASSVDAVHCSSIWRAPEEATTAPSISIAGIRHMSDIVLFTLVANTSCGTKAWHAATLRRFAHCWPSRGRTRPESAASTSVRIAVKLGCVGGHQCVITLLTAQNIWSVYASSALRLLRVIAVGIAFPQRSQRFAGPALESKE